MIARLALILVAARGAAGDAPPAPDAGRFGGSLDASRGSAVAAPDAAYARPPLTVECWARLDSARGFNVLVAHAPKESPSHWELYTTAGTGTLAAFVPGAEPSVLDSDAKVCDGRWHHLALVVEPERVRLFADARLALDAPVRRGAEAGEPGPLWLGAYPPQSIGCDGRLDEVRIRAGAFPPDAPPDGPPSADAATVGLWHLDALEGGSFADASRLRNPAAPGPSPDAPPEFAEGAAPSYRPGDPALRAELIDRSVDESFIAVRADTAGRVFVGGREAVFAYEPLGDGSYGPRVELYRFPPHSWVGDIEVLGDDLYVATSAAIYRLPGARVRRTGLAAERLVWGAPVDLHVTYHGLAFGPRGDLYFNCGDPLLNYGDFRRADHWGHWTVFAGPDARPTPYTGAGGVFRVRPDGGDFRVVARGLRGTDGLAFDRRYELFTDDNDHESLPDRYTPYRILHVTPHADFAWPRGWAAHRSPDRADLLEIANDGLDRGVPVGLAYYGDGFLPGPYRDTLLVAQWGHRTIDALAIRPRGASYAATGARPLLLAEGRARPVGVAVGRGGRVFATVAYMAQNEGSPTYPSDLVLITRADDPPGHPFEGYEAPSAPPERLWAELASADWSRRAAAHQELLRRGGDLLAEAARRLESLRPGDPSGPHLAWLAAAGGSEQARRRLEALSSSDDPVLRLQAVRALDEAGGAGPDRAPFVSALGDPDARVALAGLNALADREGTVPDAAIAGPARAEDSYLRQAAATYLAGRAGLDEARRLLRSDDAPARLAGVLAAGFRLTVPRPTGPLPDWLPLQYTSPNAAFAVRYADAEVNLRDLGRAGSFTVAERWGLGRHTAEEERLFEMLTSAVDDPDERVRLQAAYFLSLLNDPRSEPLVAAATRAVEAGRLEAAPPRPVESAWLLGPLPDGTPRRPEGGGPIDLSARYAIGDGEAAWRRADASDGAVALDPAEDAATYVYLRLQSLAASRAILQITSDDPVAVWLDGRPAYENTVGSIPGFRNLARLELRPGANDLLVRLRNRPGGSTASLAVRALDGVAVEVPERLGVAGLAQRLREAGTGEAVPEAFLAIDWSKPAGGDPERGRRLFSADGIGCARCHAVAPGEAGGGAPSLADAGRRFTAAYVVESVLTPSRQVAPVFRGTTLALTDGRILNGLIVNETTEAVEVLLPDATRASVAVADIEARRPMDLSPMPAGLVKTPEELRDLLAYLLGGDAPPGPPGVGAGGP
jgi:putative heme-binding domain-containing protein